MMWDVLVWNGRVASAARATEEPIIAAARAVKATGESCEALDGRVLGPRGNQGELLADDLGELADRSGPRT
jgi:hypothetical protein